jgi:hypothetical protein
LGQDIPTLPRSSGGGGEGKDKEKRKGKGQKIRKSILTSQLLVEFSIDLQ